MSYTYSWELDTMDRESIFDSPEDLGTWEEKEININELMESEGDEEPFYLDPAEWDE